jgi:hypothetical protein
MNKLKTKYGCTCETHNFRYLINKTAVIEVNLELRLAQLI